MDVTPHCLLFFFCLFYSHNYELVFGVSMMALNKAQRLMYGDSLMTHAMVFTGLSWEVSSEKNTHGPTERYSPPSSQVMHQAGAYSGFRDIERLTVSVISIPPVDGMLEYRRVTTINRHYESKVSCPRTQHSSD